MGKMLHLMKFNKRLVRLYRPSLSPASRPPLLLPHSEVWPLSFRSFPRIQPRWWSVAEVLNPLLLCFGCGPPNAVWRRWPVSSASSLRWFSLKPLMKMWLLRMLGAFHLKRQNGSCQLSAGIPSRRFTLTDTLRSTAPHCENVIECEGRLSNSHGFRAVPLHTHVMLLLYRKLLSHSHDSSLLPGLIWSISHSGSSPRAPLVICGNHAGCL